jgi:AcrR family transcriptional regulator
MEREAEGRRPYRSRLRQEAAQVTRRRVVDAARARFASAGYGGTTIAAVAADAGVAAETVYAAFGSKAALLEAVVRDAARGPAEAEILDQEGPGRVASAVDQREQLRLFALDVSARLARVAPLVAVVAAAAPSEPALAGVHRALHEARRANLAVLVAQLAANGPLRCEAAAATDAVWALASPELYALLTGAGGYDGARFAAWLAEALERLLLP